MWIQRFHWSVWNNWCWAVRSIQQMFIFVFVVLSSENEMTSSSPFIYSIVFRTKSNTYMKTIVIIKNFYKNYSSIMNELINILIPRTQYQFNSPSCELHLEIQDILRIQNICKILSKVRQTFKLFIVQFYRQKNNEVFNYKLAKYLDDNCKNSPF